MGIRIQNEVFNNAIANVEEANRELILIYERARDRIQAKLDRLIRKAESGLLNQTQENRIVRVERFLQSIIDDIKILKTEEANVIVNGFVENYVNGYYGYGYSINYDINNVVLKSKPFDYVVVYRRVNPAFVRELYIKEIASLVFGGPIKEKTAAEVLLLQRDIRREVMQAILEGLSPEQLARRIKKLDKVFEQNLHHAMTVSRTELLRGHSWGTETSIEIAEDQGVEGRSGWDATLDGKTRPMHGSMDQQSRNGTQPKRDGLFHFPNGDITSGPRLPGLSPGNSINCRCKKTWVVFGVTPSGRGFRAADGTWQQTTENIGYEDWANTLQGQESIATEEENRRRRAARLAKRRRRKPEFEA
jgi:hypothetical protein